MIFSLDLIFKFSLVVRGELKHTKGPRVSFFGGLFIACGTQCRGKRPFTNFETSDRWKLMTKGYIECALGYISP